MLSKVKIRLKNHLTSDLGTCCKKSTEIVRCRWKQVARWWCSYRWWVTGTPIAYYLSKGIGVILLEKDGFWHQLFMWACDIVALQFKNPGIHFTALWKVLTLADELDFDEEYNATGGMILIENEDQLKAGRILLVDDKRWSVFNNEASTRFNPGFSPHLVELHTACRMLINPMRPVSIFELQRD